MKKVIVTGGAGFIGSHTVVALYEAGFEPVIVDNFSNSQESVIGRLEEITQRKLVLHRVDCTDEGAFREVFEAEQKLFGVIHFAAFKSVNESVAEPGKYHHNNVGSQKVLLRLMKEFNVPHFVFSSSCTVYGQPNRLPVTEKSPVQPALSPYGETKQICETLIREERDAGSPLKTAILRYFNPIGAHSSALIGELPLGVPQNLVPFITQSLAEWRGPLTVFGNDYNTSDGTCIRDYIHVVDLAEAHIKALKWLGDQSKTAFAEVFNLGTGTGATILDVIRAFKKGTGLDVQYTIGDRRPGDVEQIYADVEKARTVLSWETQKSLPECARDAWNWQLQLGDKPEE